MEDDVKRLKMELKQTMDMYNAACKEALAAKQKVPESDCSSSGQTCSHHSHFITFNFSLQILQYKYPTFYSSIHNISYASWG